MTVDGSSRIHAPAKLNLNLRVTGRRGDGYHLLDSVVVFTDFGDRIGLRPAESDSVTLAGPFAGALGTAEDNICLRALAVYRQAGGKAGGFAISIDKQIPVGAGLGGGSSDAAAILRHLNSRSPAPLPAPRLAEAALSLGADVPVCLCGTAQRMRGIGDVLTPVDPAPHGHLVLAMADTVLPTADVFRTLRGQGVAEAAALQNTEITGPLADVVGAGNDLQPAAMSLSPDIARVLTELHACESVVAAQMSGSGGACFGLFAQAGHAAAAAARLSKTGIWAVATRF